MRGEEEKASSASGLSLAALRVGEAREVGGGSIRGMVPGPHRSNRPDTEEHRAVIFGLVADSGSHREIATCST
jgi:hypothetical protein